MHFSSYVFHSGRMSEKLWPYMERTLLWNHHRFFTGLHPAYAPKKNYLQPTCKEMEGSYLYSLLPSTLSLAHIAFRQLCNPWKWLGNYPDSRCCNSSIFLRQQLILGSSIPEISLGINVSWIQSAKKFKKLALTY